MQYKLRKIQEAIQQIIRTNYKAGTPQLIKEQITKLLRKYPSITPSQAKQIRLDTEKQILDQFIRQTTSPTKTLDSLLKTDYARLQGKTNQAIIKAAQRAIRNNYTMTQTSELITRQIQIAKHHANTIARTTQLAQNRAQNLRKALTTGTTLFKYVGPSTQRDFCKKHLGKVYSINEIAKMNNGQGLSVLIYAGGYNCRHRWQPVVEYQKAKTIPQAEQTARKLTGATVDYKGLPLTAANQINEGILSFISKHGKVKTIAIHPKQLKNENAVMTTNTGWISDKDSISDIQLSKLWLTTPYKFLQKALIKSSQSGQSAGSNLSDTIYHEYAHVLCISKITKTQYKELSHADISHLKPESISIDATKSGHELIAEAFVAHRHGKHLSEEIINFVKKYTGVELK